ncbi:hypothetical protein QJQ45_006415 [Haematococcus lacustris]|nr:hypothetical protein QJQ45_006415 [Haematococcus lacustris]
MERGYSPEDLQRTVEALQAQLAAKERELQESREQGKRSGGPGSSGREAIERREAHSGSAAGGGASQHGALANLGGAGLGLPVGEASGRSLPGAPAAQHVVRTNVSLPEAWKIDDVLRNRDFESYFWLVGQWCRATQQPLVAGVLQALSGDLKAAVVQLVSSYRQQGKDLTDAELEAWLRRATGCTNQNNEADLMQKLVDREYHQKGAELMSYCLQFSLMSMRLHRLPQDLLCMYFIAGLKPELKRECATMPDGKRWESLDALAFARGRDVAARAAKTSVRAVTAPLASSLPDDDGFDGGPGVAVFAGRGRSFSGRSDGRSRSRSADGGRTLQNRLNERLDRFQPSDLRRRDEGRGHNRGRSPSRDARHVSFADDRDRDRDRKRHKGPNQPSDVCYECGGRGHYAKDCANKQQHRDLPGPPLYEPIPVFDERSTCKKLILATAPTGTLSDKAETLQLPFMYVGRFGGRPCQIMMDTGATFSIISDQWLQKHKIDPSDATLEKEAMRPTPVLTANNERVVLNEKRTGLLEIQKSKTIVMARVMPRVIEGVDLILGSDWLFANDVVMKPKHGVCTLLSPEGKPVNLLALRSKHLPSFEAVAQAAVASGGLVEPAEPLSVGQTARLLRKGCRSLLLLVQPGSESDTEGWHKGSLAAAVAGCKESSGKDGSELVTDAELQAVLDEYSDVFQDMPPGLPPDRGVGHTIRMESDAPPPYKRPYKLSPTEEAEVKRQVSELQARGLIEPSGSPYGAPVLFVEKKDGSLRMCIDYRALNKLTVKDRYPLPRIDDLFDKLAGKKVFSSLDLQSGYHQIRITEADRPKTAFLTPMGQFQFKVLCFGLTNAPATFQRVMNNVFRPLINKSVLVYIDDILVMSNTAEEHVRHLKEVLELMRQHKLYAKRSKCEFNKTELAFLGHIVGEHGIAVDPAKVKVVREWHVPRNLKDLQAFLGLANYFRRFIPNFSAIAAPLTDLTSKTAAAQFDWQKFGGAHLKAFNGLKDALCSAPVLALPDFTKPFVVCTDASLVGTGAVLLQEGRPIAYTSIKLSPPETRYSTGDQELLAIIRAVREWRCYLDGAVDVTIQTDHNPLIYLQTQANLSRRQTRWMEELSRYKYEIKYHPGADNVADPISRNPALSMPATESCPVLLLVPGREGAVLAATTRRTAAELRKVAEKEQAVARERAYEAGKLTPPADMAAGTPRGLQPGGGETLRQDTEQQEASDGSDPTTLLQAVKQAYGADKRFDEAAFTSKLHRLEGLWLTERGQVVVPNDEKLRRRVIHTMHDAKSAGHLGMTKTLEQVTRYFDWPGVSEAVKHYVRTCHSCQLNKSSAQKPAGKLQPLRIPLRPWGSVSLDLIVKLPASGPAKHDSILVIVDRLTKMVHLARTWERMTAVQYAKLFVDNVFRLHGWPDSIVSDRGPNLNNNRFFVELAALLQVDLDLSSAYHPQTDGQTERMNRVIEEMLRHYIRPDQKDWAEHLPLVEFAINNAKQESTRCTPFYLNYGYHPRVAELLDLPQRVPQAHEFVANARQAVEQARQCLARAQKRMKAYQDTKRRDAVFEPGDMVLLSTQNMRGRVGQPGARKLKPRYVGPFRVEYMVGRAAVKLDLPEEWSRIHNVFHVSLVKPYRTYDASDQVPGHAGPPPLQWLDGEPEYKVEKVVDHRLAKSQGKRGGKPKKRQLEFLVKWQGHGDEHNTWETRSQLVGCQELLTAYLQKLGLESDMIEAEAPCEEELDRSEPTRPEGWKPKPGQVKDRLLWKHIHGPSSSPILLDLYKQELCDSESSDKRTLKQVDWNRYPSFPWCNCDRTTVTPFALRYVGMSIVGSEQFACFDLFLASVPFNPSPCYSMDLYKIEFDIGAPRFNSRGTFNGSNIAMSWHAGPPPRSVIKFTQLSVTQAAVASAPGRALVFATWGKSVQQHLFADNVGCRQAVAGSAMLDSRRVYRTWESSRPVLKYTNLNIPYGTESILTFELTSQCTLDRLCGGVGFCTVAPFDTTGTSGFCPISSFASVPPY